MTATALQLFGAAIVLGAAYLITPALSVLIVGALFVAAGVAMEMRENR